MIQKRRNWNSYAERVAAFHWEHRELLTESPGGFYELDESVMKCLDDFCNAVKIENSGADVAFNGCMAIVTFQNLILLLRFALLRQNADSYARRVGSRQFTLFTNCDAPMTQVRLRFFMHISK